MNKQQQLEKAIWIASNAHLGQFDKGGKPYILHPLHLMDQLLFDAQLAAIAVLHDVVEDTTWTFDELEEAGMSTRVISALKCLAHDNNESYNDYINRVCTNYDAIRVKRKDLEHNSDITRLKGITSKDFERIKKYHNAFVRLTNAKYEHERK